MKTLIATALTAVALTLGAGTAGATDPPTCYEPAVESQYKKHTAPTDAGPWTLYGTWWKGQAGAWWPGNAEVVEGPGNHPDGRYTYRKVVERATQVQVECPPPEETTTTTTEPEEETTTTTAPPPPEETTTTAPPVETTTTAPPVETTPTPEETTPEPTPTPAPSAPPPPPAPLEPQLPATGSTTGQQLAIAAAAIGAGAALARVARRRTS